MFDFGTIDEVKLARGKHISPSDGLCFLEMVSWFAGEAHSDKPECACPVLGAYAIRLNDGMPDDMRDRLLKPLVPLISGTRDSASELLRAEFLAMWAANRILPIVLRKQGFADHAAPCKNARTLAEAHDAANVAAKAAAKAVAVCAAYAADSAKSTAWAVTAILAAIRPAILAAYVAKATAYAVAAAGHAADVAKATAWVANAANAAAEAWTLAVEGLRQAILIGRHDGFDVAEPVLIKRREKLRELA